MKRPGVQAVSLCVKKPATYGTTQNHHAVRSQGCCRLQGRGPRGPPGDCEPHPLHQGHGLQGHPEHPRRWVVGWARGGSRGSVGTVDDPSAFRPHRPVDFSSLSCSVAAGRPAGRPTPRFHRQPCCPDCPPGPSIAPRTPTSWTPLRRPASTCPTPAARVGGGLDRWLTGREAVALGAKRGAGSSRPRPPLLTRPVRRHMRPPTARRLLQLRRQGGGRHR